MTEHRLNSDLHEWVLLTEAARQLGITTEALRMRIRRETMQGEKRDGRWFVKLELSPNTDRTTEQTPEQPTEQRLNEDRTTLIEVLRTEITDLRRRLDEETATHRAEIERRDILTLEQQRTIAELAGQLRALQPGEARESTHTTDSTRDGQIVDHAESGEPEPAPRPWWRFW